MAEDLSAAIATAENWFSGAGNGCGVLECRGGSAAFRTRAAQQSIIAGRSRAEDGRNF